MKVFFFARVRILLAMALFFMGTLFTIRAQQNNTLFFMHSLPEANYLNPAVQARCRVFIGLPLISSFHMNLANSGFTMGKFLTVYTDGTMARNENMQISSFPARKYLLTEFHSVLLAVGIKRNNLYYSFTITEKNNVTFIYTPDLVGFSLRGSEEYQGELLSLKGTRLMFNHLREFAFGISKNYSSSLSMGMKVKLLFGKYNFSTGNSNFGLFIEEGTRDIRFDLESKLNSSLPYILTEEAPDRYRFREIQNTSLLKQLMNWRNPGLAIDLGFIYKVDDRLTFSGSLLDLGFIWYRSNLTRYTIEGEHQYQGPFADGQITNDHLLPVFDDLNSNMNHTLSSDPYVFFLDPKLYLGAARKMNDRYDLNFLLYSRFMPGKIQTGATVSLLTRADKRFRSSISWSYMNHSVTNLGIGMSYGKNPIQLYAVTDNILGFILPMSTKNVNLRLGINLNLGCRDIFNMDQCGCEWLKKENDRRLRKERIRK